VVSQNATNIFYLNIFYLKTITLQQIILLIIILPQPYHATLFSYLKA